MHTDAQAPCADADRRFQHQQRARKRHQAHWRRRGEPAVACSRDADAPRGPPGGHHRIRRLFLRRHSLGGRDLADKRYERVCRWQARHVLRATSLFSSQARLPMHLCSCSPGNRLTRASTCIGCGSRAGLVGGHSCAASKCPTSGSSAASRSASMAQSALSHLLQIGLFVEEGGRPAVPDVAELPGPDTPQASGAAGAAASGTTCPCACVGMRPLILALPCLLICSAGCSLLHCCLNTLVSCSAAGHKTPRSGRRLPRSFLCCGEACHSSAVSLRSCFWMVRCFLYWHAHNHKAAAGHFKSGWWQGAAGQWHLRCLPPSQDPARPNRPRASASRAAPSSTLQSFWSCCRAAMHPRAGRARIRCSRTLAAAPCVDAR